MHERHFENFCLRYITVYLIYVCFIDFRSDFETRCRGTPGDACGPLSGRNLSEVVNNIVWVRQLELKVFIAFVSVFVSPRGTRN